MGLIMAGSSRFTAGEYSDWQGTAGAAHYDTALNGEAVTSYCYDTEGKRVLRDGHAPSTWHTTPSFAASHVFKENERRDMFMVDDYISVVGDEFAATEIDLRYGYDAMNRLTLVWKAGPQARDLARYTCDTTSNRR